MHIRKLISAYLPTFIKKLIKALISHKGSFRIDVGNKSLCLYHTNRWIENDVFKKGIEGYEKISMGIWIDVSKHAATIIDIGANTGLFSLVAKTVNATADVHAFEPLPIFRDVFLANCALNNYDISVNNQALSSYRGKSTFYVPQEYKGNVYSSSLSKEHYFRHQTSTPIQIDVDVITFDSYVEEKCIKSIDLVKIDAEGHDYQVLLGMSNTISKYKPDFLIEIQSDEVGQQIMSLLPATSYLYFNVDEEKGAKLVPFLSHSDTLNFFICKHATALKLGL